jgi:hypothetical protein
MGFTTGLDAVDERKPIDPADNRNPIPQFLA